MSGYISGGYNNPPIPGLSSVIDSISGAVRAAGDRRTRAKEINQQHANAMEQLAMGHQLGVHRDIINHHLGTTAQDMQNAHASKLQAAQHGHEATMQERSFGHATTMQQGQQVQEAYMANLQDNLLRNRERLGRSAETRASTKAHKQAKDMVTHVAATLGTVPGQGPVSNVTLPGGSMTFAAPTPGAAPAAPRAALPTWATTSLAPTKGGLAKPKPKKRKQTPSPAVGPSFSHSGSDPGPQSGQPPQRRRPL